MNASQLAAEVLAAQEVESLGACVARGQLPDSYQDIVQKIRGYVLQLPLERREMWAEQCQSLGVTLIPPPPPPPEPPPMRKIKEGIRVLVPAPDQTKGE